MKEPIMEFKDEKELTDCLKEWQERLFLNDWNIEVNLVTQSELSDPSHIGENEYNRTNKGSVIKIRSFTEEFKREEIGKDGHELTLVHELLHCIFIFTDGAPATMEGTFIANYEHAMIEQMAKSLIMAKYGLSIDWFKKV